MDLSLFQNWIAHDLDRLETVSVAGTVTDADVSAVRKSPPSEPEISSGAVGIQVYDILWVLDAGTIASRPARGDTITDSDSDIFTILSVRTTTYKTTPTHYRCECRKNVTST
jgi:hypothetical protein